MKWNKIDVNISNSAYCRVFKKATLKFIKIEANQLFNVNISEGLKFLTRIRL